MSNRKVIRVVTGIHTRDGAGVKLTRVIGERMSGISTRS